MRISDTTTTKSAIGTAAALWVIASAVATADRRPSRAIAVASLAAAASVVGIARAVRQAPRAEYYRGYGDASADALEAAQLHHGVAVADMAPVGHDWQNGP